MNDNIKVELLAPAGNFSKLKTAVYYGANAVYMGGKEFSLRALSDNFTDEEIIKAVEYAHNKNVKVYVTVNIFARNADLDKAAEYFKFLYSAGVDAVLITDIGLISLCKSVAPALPIHISTQANTLNKFAVKAWHNMGAERVVLARELSLKEVKEIHEFCPAVELEAFAHGAMCISYSGRCLLSNYLNGRDANRGECVQACRWSYEIRESNKGGEFYPIEQDEKGTYILNSKDLNMISHIGEMLKSGIVSLKIEGRMKSEYYLATVVNAYRRAIDEFLKIGDSYCKNTSFYDELKKTNHRAFTTAYNFGDNAETVNYADTQSSGERQFIAVVEDCAEGFITVEMRNRFKVGDELEVLSPSENFNKKFVVTEIFDEEGNSVTDAKIVQQKLKIACPFVLCEGDILRR
ncbi:MAG: U32 family peptidase [Clostridia bacterium]|nr:U32 family peptidase [Clostridia bacterium]MDY2714278.1 U32 family peptidase [Christensenellaceae bacterium]